MQNTNVHPAVTALETAMATMVAAQQQIERGSSWSASAVDSVDPARWTKQIEEALGKPEQLERLRVLYDEKALTGMSTWLSQQMAYSSLSAAHRLICDAIRDVIAAHDAIEDRGPDQWLKPIMQNRCIEAIELQQKRTPDGRIDDHSAIFSRAYDILVQAFTTLADKIRPSGIHCFYTTDLVVQGCKYETFLNRDVDLRQVHKVDFVDCVNSKHPASQKLAELFDQLDDEVSAARLAESRVKGGQNPYDSNCSKINNGTINERQHANRLMDALHGQPYGCSPSADQVTAQNERRRMYEAVRQELFIAIRQLRDLHQQMAETLHASVVETRQLLEETKQDRCTTIDRWQTLRICLNNCLAADLRLRLVGREIESLQLVYNKDLSAGAGRQAVAKQFADKAPSYRPFKFTAPPATPTE